MLRRTASRENSEVPTELDIMAATPETARTFGRSSEEMRSAWLLRRGRLFRLALSAFAVRALNPTAFQCPILKISGEYRLRYAGPNPRRSLMEGHTAHRQAHR